MRVRERADEVRSCPYCREPIEGEAPPCDGCGVRMHASCRGELERCPTLGCAAATERVLAPNVGAQVEAARVERGPPLAGRRARSAVLLAAALAPVVAAQVAFDFAPPAELKDAAGHRWELAVTCDVPGPDFAVEWDVPFEGP